MSSKGFILKKAIKNLAKEIKEKTKLYAYRDTLPRNPMHDDIYLVEFPKSGITWLQHILGNIELQLSGRSEVITFYNHHKYLPDIHQLRGSMVDRFLDRTFIKSHSEYNPFYYFVIYLIRNPFDVMVSYYNFMLFHGYKMNFSEFVRDKKFGIQKWKSHINSWFDNKTSAQKLYLIKYEDIIRDPKEEIRNIYKLLGINLQDSVLEKALKLSNLNHMQEMEKNYKKRNPNYNRVFVGKSGKIRKDNLVTDEIENYIYKVCKKEIDKFYGGKI